MPSATTTTTTTPAAPVTPITADNTTPAVYRFFDATFGTHFFTSNTSERDNILSNRPDLVQETNGFGDVSASSPNAVAVYRFFDTAHGTHFFTSDAAERDQVQATRSDLVFESSATFYEHSATASTDVAVYRLFDTKLGTHFYTGDAKEYAAITAPGQTGYVSEGVAFYAPSGNYK